MRWRQRTAVLAVGVLAIAAGCGGSEAAAPVTTATSVASASTLTTPPSTSTAAPATTSTQPAPAVTTSSSATPAATDPTSTSAAAANQATTTTAVAPPTTTAAPPATVDLPFSSSSIEGAVRDRIVGVSWREGCPVPLEDLRYLRIGYVDDGGAAQVGELVVHADVVDDVRTAFAAMYAARFPMRSMRLVDDFGGDDDASMAADNTSAFNCRFVAGTTRWSQHAYGRAIDINPLRNPYVEGDRVSPGEGAAYADRSNVRPGMIVEGDAVVAAFDALGWGWGGRWAGAADYQHFSAAGN